ncbi:hypothetical protein BDF14DRAFT_1755396 [Spinellus fusiger]|nr:hypothetical protein BDF14DRAFT_1755396 [Spinellus fusiger]
MSICHSAVTACLSRLSVAFRNTAIYCRISYEEVQEAIDLIVEPHYAQFVFDVLVEQRILTRLEDCYQVSTSPVNGILTPLTACYSPSCDGSGCYTSLCPSKPPSRTFRLNRVDSGDESLSLSIDYQQHLQRAHCLSTMEFKLQAAIAELLMSEEQYIHDLSVLHTIYAEPILQDTSCIEDIRKQKFHNIVFSNYLIISEMHQQLKIDLACQWDQDSGLFKDRVGSILHQHISTYIEPYLLYASFYPRGAYVVTSETHRNSAFAEFIQQQDGQECTRRLGLRHYLTLPTLRIGRVRLLIEAVLKYTQIEEERESIEAALKLLCSLLSQMNEVSRQSAKETRLLQIVSSLSIPYHYHLSQCLPHHPVLLHEGPLHLTRIGRTFTNTPSYVFVFAHGLLITSRHVYPNGYEEFILLSRPVPFLMLHVDALEDSLRRRLSLRAARPVLHLLSSLKHPLIESKKGSSPLSRIEQSIKRKKANSLLSVSSRLKRLSIELPEDLSSTTKLVRPSRRLTFRHLGYLDETLHFVCSSVQEKLEWQKHLQFNPSSSGPFVLDLLCDVPLICSQPRRVSGLYRIPMGYGRIRSTLPFERSEDAKSMIALGTQYGLWLGPCDGSESFHLAVHHHDCRHMAMLPGSSNFMVVHSRYPSKNLYVYDLDLLWKTCTVDTPVVEETGFTIKSFSVVCFAVGCIQQQSVLCYIKRHRAGHATAVVTLLDPSNLSLSMEGYQQYKEYPLCLSDPISVEVAHNAIFVQSSLCIERIDILSPHTENEYIVPPHPPSSTRSLSSEESSQAVVEFVPLDEEGCGLICTATAAWPVSYGGAETKEEALLSALYFESCAQRVLFVYPYLIILSSCVIEIRHLGTCELVQTISGNSIRCVYVSTLSNTKDQPQISTEIHLTMLHREKGILCVYRLCLDTYKMLS